VYDWLYTCKLFDVYIFSFFKCLCFFIFLYESVSDYVHTFNVNKTRWGCPPSNFPWTYDATETCYLLEGKVKVTPSGANEAVEISAGDLVVFPKGMSCTWDVSVGVDKHYKFE